MTTKIIYVGDIVAYKGESVRVMGIKCGDRSVHSTVPTNDWNIHVLMINRLNFWGNFVKVAVHKVVKLS